MCVHRLMGQLSKGLELIWSKRPKKRGRGRERTRMDRVGKEEVRESKKEESREKDHGTYDQTFMSHNPFSLGILGNPWTGLGRFGT